MWYDQKETNPASIQRFKLKTRQSGSDHVCKGTVKYSFKGFWFSGVSRKLISAFKGVFCERLKWIIDPHRSEIVAIKFGNTPLVLF